MSFSSSSFQRSDVKIILSYYIRYAQYPVSPSINSGHCPYKGDKINIIFWHLVFEVYTLFAEGTQLNELI